MGDSMPGKGTPVALASEDSKNAPDSPTTDGHRVLIVSTLPFRRSNRGIDILTEALGEGEYQVTHLFFPNVWYNANRSEDFDTPVRLIRGRKVRLPYVDKVMKWLPKFAFEWIKNSNAKTVDLDFSQFDAVVLESGKPMFLLDRIPESVRIIYRQSDSVRYALGEGKWYIDLEERVMDRADHIIVIKPTYQADLSPEQKAKSVIIRNGFNPPTKTDSKPGALNTGKINAVYMGLAPLDFPAVNYLVQNHPEVHFHILGQAFSKKQNRQLEAQGNFTYHGFVPAHVYNPILQYSDFAFIPYGQVKAISWMGFTSKYMNYMFFGLPILSFPTGRPGDFGDIPVKFVKNAQEMSQAIQALGPSPERLDYRFDFSHYSKVAIKKDYREFFSNEVFA